MKKHIGIIILFLQVSNLVYSQDTIRFISPNFIGKTEPVIDKIYTLPIVLTFTNNFNGKIIEVYDNYNNLICKGEFGKNKAIQPFEGGSSFQIKINKEGKTEPLNCEYSINRNGFYLKIGINKSKIIKIENKTKNIDDKIDDKYISGLLYYDAIKIKDCIKKNDISKINTILSSEFYNISNENKLRENAFLSKIFTDSTITVFTANIQANKLANNKTISSIIGVTSNIGSLDVTNIADGFAKFIVKRTKEEMNVAFFDRLKKAICDTSFKDLQSIFPQTYRTLTAIGDDIYMYDAYIQTLRESFEKDLASLPSNLPNIIDNHKKYFEQVPELEAELRTAFYMAEAIQNKQHPGEIIENYNVDILDSIQNVKAVFQTLQLFSTSLRSNNDTTYWVSYSDIKNLVKDETLLNIYLGLILQKAKNESIKFNINGKDTLLADLMNNKYKELQPYKKYLTTLATKSQTVEAKIKALNKIKSDSLLFENYYSLVSSSIDLMRSASQIDKLPFINKNDSLDLEEKAKPYLDFAQTGADIAIDVNRRNYSSAVVNIVHLYEQVSTKWNISKTDSLFAIGQIKQVTENKTIDYIKTKGELPNRQVTQHSKKQLKELQPYIDKIHYSYIYKTYFKKDAINKILQYGSFMALVAQAKTSNEVEAAIEAIALPSGTSRIKRESKFNVSVNAYCGLFLAHESPSFADFNKTRIINSYGITAPIGIAASWSHRWFFFPCCKARASSSIFISIIDLGAVTAFRFTNDTASVSKIQLKDIISPGIFYSYGIPECPISINAGLQLAPLLTKVSSSENSLSEKRAFRFTIGLCVDLPLLNLHTSSR